MKDAGAFRALMLGAGLGGVLLAGLAGGSAQAAGSALMQPGRASDVAGPGALVEAGAPLGDAARAAFAKAPAVAGSAASTSADTSTGDVQSTDALVTAFARNKCRVRPLDLPQVFGPQGFKRAFVQKQLVALRMEGKISLDAEGALSLLPEMCPPVNPAPTPRDALLARFASAGCTIDDAQIDGIGRELGLDREQMRAIVLPLADEGRIKVDGFTATLDASLCQQTK